MDLWPPFSPDLNPLEFSIWGVFEARAEATDYANLAALRAPTARVWAALDEYYGWTAYQNICRRLRQVIVAGGS
jgi:hypothetical protein